MNFHRFVLVSLDSLVFSATDRMSNIGIRGFPTWIDVTGGQPLKLAHSLLGYAVGMTDINRPGWPITRKQTHRNKF